MADKQVFIEQDTKTGKYVVREGGEIVATKDTQAEAINYAREKFPQHAVVSRVRTTDKGHPDQWRKP
jgi:hypothetical protein